MSAPGTSRQFGDTAGTVAIGLGADIVRQWRWIGRCINRPNTPERFAEMPDFSLAPRAPSIHGTYNSYNSSRFARSACGAAQTAHCLFRTLLRCCWWPDLLRSQLSRPVPACGELCRPNPEGREAFGPSGADADEIRAHHQPQDRQDARPHSAARRCSPAPTR